MPLVLRKMLVRARITYANLRGHRGKRWNYEPSEHYLGRKPPPNMGMVNNRILFSLSMIMNQELERYVMWTLAIILIVIGLSGCSYPYAPLGN